MPHKPGDDVVEMGALGPIELILADEAEEGFVDEFGGAQCGAGVIIILSGNEPNLDRD